MEFHIKKTTKADLGWRAEDQRDWRKPGWSVLPVERGMFSVSFPRLQNLGWCKSQPPGWTVDPSWQFRLAVSIQAHPPPSRTPTHQPSECRSEYWTLFSVVVRTTLMYRLIRICTRAPASPYIWFESWQCFSLTCYLPTRHQTWSGESPISREIAYWAWWGCRKIAMIRVKCYYLQWAALQSSTGSSNGAAVFGSLWS